MIKLKYTFLCTRCDSRKIVNPDEPDDGSMIICNGCGAELCSVAEFDARIKEAASSFAAEHLRNVIKNIDPPSPVIEIKF